MRQLNKMQKEDPRTGKSNTGNKTAAPDSNDSNREVIKTKKDLTKNLKDLSITATDQSLMICSAP